MKWKYEKEFRKDNPETIGETDKHFDLDNYKDWLEVELKEAKEREKELLEEIVPIFEKYDKGTDTYKRLEKLINKLTNTK
jgi:hypothetical protein